MNKRERLEVALMAVEREINSLPEDDPERETKIQEAQQLAAELRKETGRKEEPEKPAEKPKGSILNPIAEGMLAGAGNEVASMGAAAVGTMLPERMGGFSSANQPEGFFRAQQAIERDLDAREAEYTERNPLAAFGAEMAASAIPITKATTAMTRAVSGPNRAPLRRMSENVATGATIEGAYGYAAAPAGDRAEGAGMGALFGGPTAGLFGEVGNMLAKRKAQREAASKSLQEGTGETVTVGWRMQEQGQGVPELVPDQLAREARRQQVPEDMILSVKAGTPRDVSLMEEMVQIQKQRDTNPRARIFKRPANVAGQAVQDRVDDLLQVRREAGEDLRRVAEETLQGVPAPIEQITDAFSQRLSDMGVTFDEAGDLIFQGSEFQGSKGSQKTIRDAMAIIDTGMDVDGLSVHRMKKSIDSLISEKTAKGSIGASTKNMLEQLRRDLNAMARDLDNTGQYAEVNDEFSTATQALDTLNSYMPAKVDLDDETSAQTLGSLLRKLTGNSVNREGLLASLAEVDATAKGFGFDYDDDVVTLTAFLRDMEDMFGPVGDTSLAGDVARTMTGRDGSETLTGKAMDVARSQTGRLIGIDRDNAYRAVEALLESYK